MSNKNPSKAEKQSGRALAFQALWEIEVKEAYADLALDELFRSRRPPRPERALATELTLGVLRWRLLLDYYLEQVADRPLLKIERKARLALRLGAYQLLKLDRVASAAAVNSSVALAPPSARGFVNAVLRALAATKADLPGPETIRDPILSLAVAESHPRWLVEEWVKRLGETDAAALMQANNERPGLTLRVNTLRTGREAMLRLLERQGIGAEAGKWSPLAIKLQGPEVVSELPGYAEGLFAVQDEASQLAPLILAPQPGEAVLDACAAPGQKSLEIMQLMNGHGRVLAVDIHAGRLSRMAGEAKRLGLRGITRLVADSTKPLPRPERFAGIAFDRVLVDAPCSGLGILRRRPEIKWRRQPTDLEARAEIQRAILTTAAGLLKPGGILVYSTCTFTVEENEGVVAALSASGDLMAEDPGEFAPALAGLTEAKALRTWPHRTGTDGFTIFRWRKR